MGALQQALLGAGGGPPVTAGLFLWHEGRLQSGLSDGDLVASLTDLTGNGRHATQAGADSLKPTFQTNECNGWPVIRSDGIDDYLEWTGGALSAANNQSGMTVYAVVRSASVAAGAKRFVYFSNGLSAGSIRFAVSLTGDKFEVSGRRQDADSLQTVTGTTAYSTGTWYLVSAVFDYANSDVRLYVNGALEINSTSFQTDGNTSATDSIRARFESSSNVNLWNGDVAALLLYRGAHGTGDRHLVEDWLAGTALYNLAITH
jgi:hypothetical protein